MCTKRNNHPKRWRKDFSLDEDYARQTQAFQRENTTKLKREHAYAAVSTTRKILNRVTYQGLAIALNGVESVTLTVEMLIRCMQALGHPTRLKMLQYCLKPRTFSDLMFDLRLNPASFKHHIEILINRGMIAKVDRGKYEDTMLGKLLFGAILKFAKIVQEKNVAKF